jgi:hypothetical protein
LRLCLFDFLFVLRHQHGQRPAFPFGIRNLSSQLPALAHKIRDLCLQRSQLLACAPPELLVALDSRAKLGCGVVF